MNGPVLNFAAPPDDLPKMDGLDRAVDMLSSVKTGWALRVGFDVTGQPILLFRDEILPPNRFRRWLTAVLTGMAWIKNE